MNAETRDKKIIKQVNLMPGQMFQMKDGTQYVTTDRGQLLRLTPRKGRKSRRRAE